MKTLIISICLAVVQSSFAQNINYKSLSDEQKSLVYLNFGYDFGITTQLGYAYHVKVLNKSTLLNVDASIPMGKTLFDDFKVRYGAQMKLVTVGSFAVTTRIYGITRRHRTALVDITSFGSEFAALVGYYKSSWYLTAEFGFDKAITTHIKNSTAMKTDFPEIHNGWYTATGGNYFAGLTTGKTLSKNMDLTLRLGAVNAQRTDKDPVLPYYVQICVIQKF